MQSALDTLKNGGTFGVLTLTGSGSLLVSTSLSVFGQTDLTIQGDPTLGPYGTQIIGENTPGYQYRIADGKTDNSTVSPIFRTVFCVRVTYTHLDFRGYAKGPDGVTRILDGPAIHTFFSNDTAMRQVRIVGSRRMAIMTRNSNRTVIDQTVIVMNRQAVGEPDGGTALWSYNPVIGVRVTNSNISAPDYDNSGPAGGGNPAMDLIGAYGGLSEEISGTELQATNSISIFSSCLSKNSVNWTKLGFTHP